jgi:voltage-gated potassium channel
MGLLHRIKHTVRDVRGRRARLRFSIAGLLLILVLFFVATPFVGQLPGGNVIDPSLFSLVIGAALLTVGGRRTMLYGALLALPALAARWGCEFRPELLPLFLVSAMAFVLFVAVKLLAFVLRAEIVDNEVLCGALAAYLLFGLLWGLAYSLVWSFNTDAFAFNLPVDASRRMEGFIAYYFSFITLTTAGYGDIVPIANVARMLAAMEAIVGPLYIAILVASLVASHSDEATRDPADGND